MEGEKYSPGKKIAPKDKTPGTQQARQSCVVI